MDADSHGYDDRTNAGEHGGAGHPTDGKRDGPQPGDVQRFQAGALDGAATRSPPDVSDHLSERTRIDTLIAIMAALRHPVSGCPWDKEQTFASIAPYTIEEAYEVADAIERADLVDLKDELGDLLFQVVYHARIAEEAGAFAFADVVGAISEKMVRRHPHVFGTAAERAAGPAPGFWERIKAAERAQKAKERAGAEAAALAELSDKATETEEPWLRDGLLDAVPRNLPPLTQALKLQKKAARMGFDWATLVPVIAKVREELGELEEALAGDDPDARSAELGDLLFAVANLGRHLDCDPERALAATNAKFRRRFGYIEEQLRKSGKSLESATLDEMEALWAACKSREAGAPQ